MKEIKAFSLIEISVVLLIVAIFIAAISSGKLLIGKADDINQQQVIDNLRSQQYYDDKAFEVSAADIINDCGSNPSVVAMSDYLYNNIKKDDGGCCSASDNIESLCCDFNIAACQCGNDGYPDCICNNGEPEGCPPAVN